MMNQLLNVTRLNKLEGEVSVVQAAVSSIRDSVTIHQQLESLENAVRVKNLHFLNFPHTHLSKYIIV